MRVIPAKSGAQELVQYRAEAIEELYSILTYWEQHTVDKTNGGFFGSVDNNNIPDHSAPKGIVLNSRILWAFSASYSFTKKDSHLLTAHRAYNYICNYFIDKSYGGVYWSVDANGNMLEGRKQIYGLAFCIYGLAEYFKVTGIDEALGHAIELFNCIEKYSLDQELGGYVEAFDREWKPLADLRLSEKDDNERKTMNTHLHIIEAYANLYEVWPDSHLREKIFLLLDLFNRHIINDATMHLNLFMDDNWSLKSALQSYGHDIEAAWLLQVCAGVTKNKPYINHFGELAVEISEAAAQGLDNDGGLWYEYEPSKNHLIKEKHSWPQAEAMIGFFNSWQLTGNDKYLDYSLNCWEFVKKHIRDNKNGEWFWGVHENYSIMEKDKAGFWKCPYHNTRACLEIIRRTGDVGPA